MKYIFAGNREISVNILRWMIERGYSPSALFVCDGSSMKHAEQLVGVANLSSDKVYYGTNFKSEKAIEVVEELDVDYIFGIHFPFIIPNQLLKLPKIGFLNLHPAFLPYNKGWHTPSWAILDGTPYGATLHFMTEELDKGDIILQRKINIAPDDTANTLYKKVLKLEEEVFKEAFPQILALNPGRQKQKGAGTSHNKKDLQNVQRLNLNEKQKIGETIKKFRALTTNNVKEAAYFEINEKKYFVQLKVTEVDSE